LIQHTYKLVIAIQLTVFTDVTVIVNGTFRFSDKSVIAIP